MQGHSQWDNRRGTGIMSGMEGYKRKERGLGSGSAAELCMVQTQRGGSGGCPQSRARPSLSSALPPLAQQQGVPTRGARRLPWI